MQCRWEEKLCRTDFVKGIVGLMVLILYPFSVVYVIHGQPPIWPLHKQGINQIVIMLLMYHGMLYV